MVYNPGILIIYQNTEEFVSKTTPFSLVPVFVHDGLNMYVSSNLFNNFQGCKLIKQMYERENGTKSTSYGNKPRLALKTRESFNSQDIV